MSLTSCQVVVVDADENANPHFPAETLWQNCVVMSDANVAPNTGKYLQPFILIAVFSIKTQLHFFLESLKPAFLSVSDYGTALKKGSPCNSNSRTPTLGHRDLGLRWLLAAIHVTGNDNTDCLHPARHIAYTIKSTIRERVFISIFSMVG